MRMGNPSLRRLVAKSDRGEMGVEIEPATYKGIYGKSAILGAVTLISAVATELVVYLLMKNDLASALVGVSIATSVCFLPLLIMSFVIAFVPSTAKFLGILYSLLQGGLIGCLSLFVDMFAVPGISIAALIGTAVVFLISVAVNKLMEVKISSKFARGLMIAFLSLIVVEPVMWALTAFGVFTYSETTYWWIQLAVAAVCVIWATVMLAWDLQNIDFMVQVGADKKYEWNMAFSLVTTLVYLYVEILELILRIVMLFGKNKN